MSRESHRRADPGDNQAAAIAAVAAVAVIALAGLGWMAWTKYTGPIRGALLVTGAVLAALGIAACIAGIKRHLGSTRIDYKAKYMATARDMHELTESGAARDAARLGASDAGPGVPIGTHLPSGQRIFSMYEWVQIWIMGPRAGKTSCQCIPRLIEHCGPALFTTNKIDGIPETRGPRSMQGVTWVNDVQAIVGEKPTWVYDPLTFVTNYESAERLTDVFITASTSAGATQDAYFSSAGKETLARLFLAAALDHRDVTDVFRWANDPDNETGTPGDDPARILYAYGEQAHAEALYQTQHLTSRQRDGVYGTLRPWITVLGNRAVLPWITSAGSFDKRPSFDPAAFVVSTDTIYLVSKEGPGSARAITAALTMAILTAAERAATASGGRLRVPLLGELDEVANVCRWRELPDVYSHFGSKGILLSSYFQSWAQGVEAFGTTGMQKLWSAANVRGIGAGLSEDGFCRYAAESIGPRDVIHRSRNTGRGGASTSTSKSREQIFETADIVELPRGRAIVQISGFRAALVRLNPWFKQPYADVVAASKAHYSATAKKVAA